MHEVVFLVLIALVTLLVAWLVNGMVGWMSGERPRDTGRLWADILELSLIGCLLDRMGLKRWPGKLAAVVGMVCVLIFLVKSCKREESSDKYRYEPSPVQSE